MSPPPIDLRSDTVTRPSPGMRRAMAEAIVGDDVFGDDPTVRILERRAAELLGKEAALFTPSGTMANQIAVGLHCRPGDELLCSSTAHVHLWEVGGVARLWGVTTRTFIGDGGLLRLSDVEDRVRPDDPHYVRTRLVCLENTHNRGGGRGQPLEDVQAISRWAREEKLAMHLDGARLMNAVAATGTPASEWAKPFDTVSICFSKGLGAPAGSVLAGPAELMHQARRLRKLLGGGMRQAGVLAAACLYALDHNVARLQEDHANARILAEAFSEVEGLHLEFDEIETNLVWVLVDPELGTAEEVVAHLASHGILTSVMGERSLRAATHLDVSRADALQAAEIIRAIDPGTLAAETVVY